MPTEQRQPGAAALTVLGEGEVELRGRMPWSSNATFLVTVHHGEASLDAVYKPLRGERELWDFPDGLYRREVAAWIVSEALGWELVPETIVREDAPLGEGSLQRFVDADFSQHYFTLLERPEHLGALRTIATFDLLVNNADRKGGHCLVDADGHVWGIDNGLSFHTAPKLRTVIWDFVGEDVPAALVDDIRHLLDAPDATVERLAPVLAGDEIDAFLRRAEAVVRRPVFPPPRSSHPYPWPLV